MKITKTGFYKLSKINEKNIIIGDNIRVFLFDDDNTVKDIKIGNNSNVEYYSYFSGERIFEKNISIIGEKSKVKCRSLLFSENNKLTVKIFGNIKSNFSSIDMKILSFAGEKGNINLDGILKIDSGTRGTVGHLDEENIFLGNNAQISGIPILLVETNDVVASHSCSMERISDEKLFYLRSRGIEKEKSLQMVIEAKIIDLFRCLEMIDKNLFDSLIKL